MKYYKHPNGDIYSFETQTEKENFGPPELSEMTQEAILLHLNPPQQIVIPTSVTMVQARLALLAIGLLDDVEAGISSMSKAAQIEWEFRPTVERSSTLVQSLALALNLDSAALDSLFTEASKL